MSATQEAGGALALALRRGAETLGQNLDDAQIDQLLAYQALIQKWNRVYNLTSVRAPEDMLTHHLLDSLAAVAPLLRQVGPGPIRLLDVGSGGGLPGVVLAIVCAQIQVTCVDTVLKKATFIQQVAASLQLRNLRGLHARVESIGTGGAEAGGYDVVCSRAFASLGDFTSWSRAALKPGGIWMAMKGKHPADELAGLPPGLEVFHVEQL
ncbi:16S rRNA (guanine(527)-N(7))-methyltransferase RsmG, partial [Hydrogenophaga sp.]|uniref:16S rRNA (guanine(527)-N(7))-methyltransferase RsmG n=1 Tax=Hydrogenophaga sp. TaxID=1904254 RepID=UPI003566F245